MVVCENYGTSTTTLGIPNIYSLSVKQAFLCNEFRWFIHLFQGQPKNVWLNHQSAPIHHPERQQEIGKRTVVSGEDGSPF